MANVADADHVAIVAGVAEAQYLYVLFGRQNMTHIGDRPGDQPGNRLAEMTSALVGFPTLAGDPAALKQCIEWVYGHIYTQAPDVRVQRFESAGKPSILLSHGDGPIRVLLCGHLDVVEATHPEAFHMQRDSLSRLAGRGTADMKGPIAALIDVFESEPVPGSGLLLTTDEESGGAHGTGYVLDQLTSLPEVVVLPDGGANFRLVVEQKGTVRLRLIAKGRAAHGSRPWLGENAIEKLYRGYQALQQCYPQPRSEDDWRTSITLTQIQSVDNAPNSVPDRAEGILDIRYTADVGGTDQDLVSRVAATLAGYGVEVEALINANQFALDANAPWVRCLQEVVMQVRGAPLPLCKEAGASDARYFSERNIPVLVFQPDCAGWHGANEWVSLESLVMFREICAQFVRAALA